MAVGAAKNDLDESVAQAIAEAAREAGEAILQIVARGFDVEQKARLSPVTEADSAAELIILAALAEAAPGVPVIAEEEVAAGRIPAHGDIFPRRSARRHQGIRPRRRRYTVNIALIVDGTPRLGAVYRAGDAGGCTPASPGPARGSRKTAGGGRSLADRAEAAVAVASKSHFTQNTADYLDAVGAVDHVAVGSSLQILHRRRGQAPTSIRGCRQPANGTRRRAMRYCWPPAGGSTGPTARRSRYGKPAFLNRAFIATGGWEAPPWAVPRGFRRWWRAAARSLELSAAC